MGNFLFFSSLSLISEMFFNKQTIFIIKPNHIILKRQYLGYQKVPAFLPIAQISS